MQVILNRTLSNWAGFRQFHALSSYQRPSKVSPLAKLHELAGLPPIPTTPRRKKVLQVAQQKSVSKKLGRRTKNWIEKQKSSSVFLGEESAGLLSTRTQHSLVQGQQLRIMAAESEPKVLQGVLGEITVLVSIIQFQVLTDL